jgi:hypothetical protein
MADKVTGSGGVCTRVNNGGSRSAALAKEPKSPPWLLWCMAVAPLRFNAEMGRSRHLGSEAVKQEAAYHEAGHAVIACALGCKVRFVIIDPNGGGECQCDDPPEGERDRKIMLCFAGPAAQRKHKPSSWKSWHGNDDYRKAVELVQGLGVSDERVTALIRETLALVEQHWARIERFAQVLLERGTLQGDEIDAQFAD